MSAVATAGVEIDRAELTFVLQASLMAQRADLIQKFMEALKE